MSTETVVAFYLLVCSILYFTFNLYNILRVHKRGSGLTVYAEVERPLGAIVSLAAVGTLAYFFEIFLYLFLVFAGFISGLDGFLYLRFPFMFQLQIFGLSLTSLGYFLFIWSVVARGRYAVSWKMPENQKLVTWGPYRYGRHPSYFGYFLMFFGFFFLWPNFLTLFPLIAIPGYYRITFDEERLLVQRFGDEYLEYQKKVGRFFLV
jgi:protein-S-isoprenylcysteine O-methyltransferase Ste14